MSRRRALALLLAAGLVGCEGRREPPPPPAPPRTILVLADRSKSSALVDTRRMFAETFHKFAGQVHPGDVLAAAWISDRSISEIRLPINHAFPAPDTAGRNDYYRRLIVEAARKDAAQAAETLAIRFDSLLADTGNAAPSTDILSSFDLAERVFHRYPKTATVLLVMSDMIENSRALRIDTLTNRGIEPLVSRLRKAGRVPNLTGVRICVLGATHPNPERFRIIRDFWTQYFAATGAELRDYGAALVRAEC